MLAKAMSYQEDHDANTTSGWPAVCSRSVLPGSARFSQHIISIEHLEIPHKPSPIVGFRMSNSLSPSTWAWYGGPACLVRWSQCIGGHGCQINLVLPTPSCIIEARQRTARVEICQRPICREELQPCIFKVWRISMTWPFWPVFTALHVSNISRDDAPYTIPRYRRPLVAKLVCGSALCNCRRSEWSTEISATQKSHRAVFTHPLYSTPIRTFSLIVR